MPIWMMTIINPVGGQSMSLFHPLYKHNGVKHLLTIIYVLKYPAFQLLTEVELQPVVEQRQWRN